MAKKSDRRVIDKVFVLLGVAAVAVLVVVGGLAWYGYNFATNQVHDELAAQKIFFPPKGSAALDPKEFPDLQQYAGKQVLDGPTAKAFANGYIARHLKKIAGGKTYSEVSNLAMANPKDPKLQVEKATLFQGETLRGILLGTGYAYWTFGMIAKYVALAAWAGAAAMTLLVMLGIRHMNRLK